MNLPVPAFEKKLFKFFFVFFLALHVLAILSVPLSSFLSPIEKEVSFTVDILPETVAPAKTNEATKPNTNILPQLPKKFSVKSEQLTSLPKTVLNKADASEQSDEVIANNDDTNLIKAKEALKRLALERLRTQKKQETKTQQVLNKQMHKALLNISAIKNNSDAVRSKYQTVLRVFIRRNFILPDIHDLKNADIKVKLEIKINDKGYLSKMRIIQSSNNKIFDELAASAVKNSSPFPTPPRELIEQDIIIILTPLMTS